MSVHRNQRLFSDHYLNEILPKSIEWQEIDQDKLTKAFNAIKTLYQEKRETLPSLNESQLEDNWIRPILKILGHFYASNPSIPKMREGTKQPDYVFYPTREAAVNKDLKQAIAIGEAKRYKRPLDKNLKLHPEDTQNPSLQISRYLWLSEVKWGILTDGKIWRLYERETSKRLDIFYEIDLDKIFQAPRKELFPPPIENFKYFYLFFRREAFPEFLKKVYAESLDYAKAVGEELKENVYQALKILSEGFLKISDNNLTQENLKEIHDNALILLYRLLFILYAEYRKLLPLGENQIYTDSYSLDAIKKEITKKLDKNTSLSHTGAHTWMRLKELFEIINNGREEMGVPAYNGGLFDPHKHPFLEEKRVGDYYLARVIDLLSRSSDKAFIDYSSLDIRHLGSLYEGLLEYKLKIAEKDMKAVKEKGKLVWKSSQEIGNARFIDEVKKGELYLVTDKGERKATGSYYTPDYIVKYIIENTLGPVIEEKKKKILKETEELRTKIKQSRGYNRKTYEKKLRNKESDLINEILSIKVLDPAMGSGHFLVEATDYLARALVEALSGEIFVETERDTYGIQEKKEDYKVEEREEEDIRWARREIVERCIFGVDLNPLAVELAKLSLWLSTVSKGKPLNFLDHHLKCGNSLIGAKIADLNVLPVLKKKKLKTEKPQLKLFNFSKFKQDIALAVGDFIAIEEKLSEKVSDIKDKENILDKLNKTRLNKYRKIADLWTSVYFGNEIDNNIYRVLNDYILGERELIPGGEKFLKKAEEINREKRFFHWEIEFPEVFFDKHGRRKDNPGFDAVVGNPPWVESKFLESILKSYFRSNFVTMWRQYDIFNGFIEISRKILPQQGFFGMILPNRFCLNPDYYKLRKYLLENYGYLSIKDYGDGVFPDVNMPSCIFIGKPSDSREMVNIINFKGISFEISKNAIVKEPLLNIRIDTTPSLEILIRKCWMQALPLRTYYTNARGVEIGKGNRCVLNEPTPGTVKFGVGENLTRYLFEPKFYLKLNVSHIDYKDPSLYQGSKIIVRKTGHGINASLDRCGTFVIQVVYIFRRKPEIWIEDLFTLAILNSKLLYHIYYGLFGEREKKTFPHIRQEHFLQLPIRCISFTTPKPTREKLVNEFKKIYEEWVKI